MGAFGERLRREREMRGISLEEIAAATKIGTRNLKALEEENFKILPGGIFNKGFVRAYARFLGISEEQAVADYLAACGEPEELEINAAQLIAQKETFEAESRAASRRAKELKSLEVDGASGFPIMGLIGLILVLALAWGGRVGYVKYKAHREQQAQEQREAQERAQQEAAARAAQVAAEQAMAQNTAQVPSQVTTDASAVNPPSSAAPVAQPSATGNAKTAPSTSTATAPSAQPSSVTAATRPATQSITVAPGNFVLSVRARQRIWVSVNADGKHVMDGELQPSTRRDFQARDHITIKMGNAGGTDIALNGKQLPSLGAESQVRTVKISADGTVQDAPGTMDQ